MSQEQDQEKLLNASTQAAHNVVATAASLISLKKPQTKVEIKTAKDQVQQAQRLIQQGTSLAEVKNKIANSAIAQKLVEAGDKSQKYVNSIIRKANINIALENNQQTKTVPTKKINKTR